MLFIASFGFFSCSNTDDAEISSDFNKDLLKNYAVKRDANGAYSIDFNVSEKVKVDKVLNQNSNFSQFYLYSSDNNSERKITEELIIDGSQLKVDFIDTNSKRNTNISVIDDNITFAKSSDNNAKLKSYSVSKNDDGSFEVIFEVKNNVDVNFVYNESEDTYEIHLNNGKGNTTNFSRTLEKKDGKPLQVAFLNYVSNPNAKSDELTVIRKPVIIIEED